MNESFVPQDKNQKNPQKNCDPVQDPLHPQRNANDTEKREPLKLRTQKVAGRTFYSAQIPENGRTIGMYEGDMFLSVLSEGKPATRFQAEQKPQWEQLTAFDVTRTGLGGAKERLAQEISNRKMEERRQGADRMVKDARQNAEKMEDIRYVVDKLKSTGETSVRRSPKEKKEFTALLERFDKTQQWVEYGVEMALWDKNHPGDAATKHLPRIPAATIRADIDGLQKAVDAFKVEARGVQPQTIERWDGIKQWKDANGKTKRVDSALMNKTWYFVTEDGDIARHSGKEFTWLKDAELTDYQEVFKGKIEELKNIEQDFEKNMKLL